MLRYAFDGLCNRGLFDGYNGMMRNWGSGGWIGMMFGGLFFTILLILVVILIVAMIRRHGPGMHGGPMEHGQHGGPGGPGGPGHEDAFRKNVDSALAILNERYAKGEINQEEYLAKKNDLMK